MVNVGYGAHLSLSVAMVRALTEAAQSRLTYIHGAREDMAVKIRAPAAQQVDKVFEFFSRMQANTAWQTLDDWHSDDFLEDYERVLETFRELGLSRIYRVNLTRDPFHIPVVKVFACGLTMRQGLF
jgi:ribosomal protein S12 methylthiotransferase accessory factor